MSEASEPRPKTSFHFKMPPKWLTMLTASVLAGVVAYLMTANQ